MRNTGNNNKSLYDILILSILTEGDTYGYQFSQKLQELSAGSIHILDGSLYPVLYKLERDKYITKYSKIAPSGKERVYYHIEPEGRKYLAAGIAQYYASARAIDSILKKAEINLEQDKKDWPCLSTAGIPCYAES